MEVEEKTPLIFSRYSMDSRLDFIILQGRDNQHFEQLLVLSLSQTLAPAFDIMKSPIALSSHEETDQNFIVFDELPGLSLSLPFLSPIKHRRRMQLYI